MDTPLMNVARFCAFLVTVWTMHGISKRCIDLREGDEKFPWRTVLGCVIYIFVWLISWLVVLWVHEKGL